MKIEGKITFLDAILIIINILLIGVMVGVALGGWWYLIYIEFTIKQLLINVLITSSVSFVAWVFFTKMFVIKIKWSNKENGK